MPSNITLVEVNLWILGSIGLVAGLLGSTLGVGGGIFIVPMLTLALHLPIHIAIGSSLIAIVATSCTAASIYVKSRLTNIKLGLLLGTATIPGAIIGALVAAFLTSSILSALFGIILIYTAYRMVVQHLSTAGALPSEDNSFKPDHAMVNKLNDLTDSYYDQNMDRIITYRVNHTPQGLVAGFFGGTLSGLLGIGGGIVNVPVMNLVMGLPIKTAIGTSSFIIVMTTAASAFIYCFHGYIYPIIVAPLVLGAFIGARAGAELTRRAERTFLNRIFAVFLLIIAILMVIKASNISLAT